MRALAKRLDYVLHESSGLGSNSVTLPFLERRRFLLLVCHRLSPPSIRLATTNIAVLARVAAGMNRRHYSGRAVAEFDLSAAATLRLGAGFQPIANSLGWPTASMVVFVNFLRHNIGLLILNPATGRVC